MLLIFLGLASIFNVFAQSLLKISTSRMGVTDFSIHSLLQIVSSPLIWLGALIYGASFVCYVFALSKQPLGQVGPASQILTIVGLVVVSTVLFRDPLTIQRILGIMLSAVGVYTLLR